MDLLLLLEEEVLGEGEGEGLIEGEMEIDGEGLTEEMILLRLMLGLLDLTLGNLLDGLPMKRIGSFKGGRTDEGVALMKSRGKVTPLFPANAFSIVSWLLPNPKNPSALACLTWKRRSRTSLPILMNSGLPPTCGLPVLTSVGISNWNAPTAFLNDCS